MTNKPEIDEYDDAWRDLESIEAFEAEIRLNPQKFAKEWDVNAVRIRLRVSLTLGATVDSFVNDPEVISGNDFLHGELTASEISRFLGYTTNHIYRVLDSEYGYVARIEE